MFSLLEAIPGVIPWPSKGNYILCQFAPGRANWHIIDIKPPYNVNIAAEAALIASIEDAPALQENVNKIIAERERMFSLLEAIPGVTPWPSKGNYILCQFAPGRAKQVYEDLAMKGIFVRDFSTERLKDYFRAGVGLPAETDAFIEGLKAVV